MSSGIRQLEVRDPEGAGPFPAVVQYPTAEDPTDANKVVPATTLAATLMDRVQKDESIGLDKNALGLSTKLEKQKAKEAAASSKTASPTPDPTESAASDVIAGLRGQTAAEQTCSKAFGS